MPAAGYKEVVPPDMWSVFSVPAAATQATASKAANASQRHVCSSIRQRWPLAPPLKPLPQF